MASLFYCCIYLVLLGFGLFHSGTTEYIAAACSHCLYGGDFCQADDRCLYGCVYGWAGDNCKRPCSISNCVECDLDTAGSEKCKRCSSGYWGKYCDNQCSRRCIYKGNNLDVCDHQGRCLYGCDLGWSGNFCDVRDCPYSNCDVCSTSFQIWCTSCSDGYFWSFPESSCLPCSTNCAGDGATCDRGTGFCLHGCKGEYFGRLCNYQCDLDRCLTCFENIQSGNPKRCSVCEDEYYPDANTHYCVKCNVYCNGTCNNTTGYCDHCKDDYFGDRCHSLCDIENCGKCKLDLFSNSICETCKDGFYLDDFKCKACPDLCEGGPTQCDKQTGACLKGCQGGHYGDVCQYLCSEHCVQQCDPRDGTCNCKDGWFGELCNQPCPVNCADCNIYVNDTCGSCDAGFYGRQCESKCSRHCQRNSHTNYLYCDQMTGSCSDGCISSYYGDVCDQMCSETCADRVCAQDTGLCSHGCSYYHYGQGCSKRCSSDCKDPMNLDRSCDKVTGLCLHGCREDRLYGEYCNLTCNYNCKGLRCDQITGLCTHGCMTGYYGTDCDKLCSRNCKDGLCARESAMCVTGCQTGYHGLLCNSDCNTNCPMNKCQQNGGECTQSCLSGKYGPNCDLLCPKNCLNETCYLSTGMCMFGCVTGKKGEFCREDCSPGYYGINCVGLCGRCKGDAACSVTDGACREGCLEGFHGDNCNEQVDRYASPDHLDIAIPVGCSLGALAVWCALMVGVVFWCRSVRKKRQQQKLSEPGVLYRPSASDTASGSVSMTVPTVSIQSVEGPSRGNTDTQHIERNSSLVSVHESDSPLMASRTGKHSSVVKIGNVLNETEIYVLYSGRVRIDGEFVPSNIKAIHLDEPGKEERLKRLKKESEILHLIGNHRNIVNVLAVKCDPDMYCLCMENYFEYGTLQNYLQSEELHEANLTTFAMDVTQGVAYLHSNQILHRHLLAKSVYLSENLVVKISDFDWATSLRGTDMQTACFENEENLPDDNLQWLAPENLSTTRRFSAKSDVWSLGMLIWEIFTCGDTPYRNLDTEGLKKARIDGVLPPKPYRASIPLYRVMKRCWRYAPEDRPTADQVYDQLMKYQARAVIEDIQTIGVAV